MLPLHGGALHKDIVSTFASPMVEMILARSIMISLRIMTGSIISTISRSLLAQLEEISFLEEDTPVLQLNLVPAAPLDDDDVNEDENDDKDDKDDDAGNDGGTVHLATHVSK